MLYSEVFCGKRGIRTPGTPEGTNDFESFPFDHSGIFPYNTKTEDFMGLLWPGGERGIRTPGGITLNGFQDRRIRPLCHLSGDKSKTIFVFQKKKFNNLGTFFEKLF
jgi:hypothetical protein